MRFLVDAQLPRRIAYWLRDAGQDAIHTLDLPDQNRTTDSELVARADAERRVVVTKDADFVESFVLLRRPAQLLLISTGNISNAELESILGPNLDAIVAAFQIGDFVEINRSGVIVHS